MKRHNEGDGKARMVAPAKARLAFLGRGIIVNFALSWRKTWLSGDCLAMEDGMSDDVKLCIDILNKAIAFEEEGMRFFKDRAENAPSNLERNIFHSLAKDESGHKAYLLRLRDELVRTNNIDSLTEDDQEHHPPRQVFEESLASVQDPYNAEAEELEILNGAMEVEKKGFAMYSHAAKEVKSSKARELFEHLAAEEQNHYQLLRNTYDYMSNPEEWHGFDESPMLDGG